MGGGKHVADSPLSAVQATSLAGGPSELPASVAGDRILSAASQSEVLLTAAASEWEGGLRRTSVRICVTQVWVLLRSRERSESQAQEAVSWLGLAVGKYRDARQAMHT